MPNTMTLEQKAYEVIQNSIIQGRYAPGTYITEATLVKDLNMSRTPIRRALAKLEASGFVKHYSHQGSLVQNTQITMIEIINFIEFRLFLGKGSIEKAKRKFLNFPIKEMRDSLYKMKNAVQKEEPSIYFNEENHFNNLILSPTQNELIIENMVQLQKRFIIGSNKYFDIRKSTFLSTISRYEALVNHLENNHYDDAANLFNEIKREIIQDLF